MGRLERRLGRLERSLNASSGRCIWCEQRYWTMVCLNPAIGPYSKTEHGNECGLVFSRALAELCGDVVEDHYPRNLPTYDLDAGEHEAFLLAYAAVEESRPPRAGCECIEVARAFRSIEARVLHHYPRVAEAAVACLQEYARKPPDPRALYHWPGGSDGCVCAPSPVGPSHPRSPTS